MPAIYGDSFGDLQRNVTADTAMRQQALARALDTAVQSLQAARAHATELQSMNTQKQQFQQEMQQRQAETAQQKTQMDRTFQLEQQRNQQEQERIDIERKRYTEEMTPSKQREHDFQFNQATSDADNGTFDNVEHVNKLYPSLTPAEAGVIFERSQQARRQIVNDNVTADNAAMLLNKESQIRQRIYQIGDGSPANPGELTKAKKSVGLFSRTANDPDVVRLTNERQSLMEEQQRISPIAEALSKDKNVNNLITFDPNSEQYVSNLAKPRWMTSPAGDNTPDTEPENAGESETSTSGTSTTPSAPPATNPTRTTSNANEPTVKMVNRMGVVYDIRQSQIATALSRGARYLNPPPRQQGPMETHALDSAFSGVPGQDVSSGL